ncbi:MAG TPA: hypothetical protein VES73_03730, partial [Lamprocystis sp. (in: g-proteobacteria)]|nr:hypothetical protein [Lamprocystis sp. (in: g-proteobacteria)]
TAIAAATLEEADTLCFPGWWNGSGVDPELSRAVLLMIATRFPAAGLLADDAMGFIRGLVEVLRGRHYQSRQKDEAGGCPGV